MVANYALKAAYDSPRILVVVVTSGNEVVTTTVQKFVVRKEGREGVRKDHKKFFKFAENRICYS